MRTKTLLTALIIVLTFNSCQKQIDKSNQSQAEAAAARRGGPNKNPPVANAGNDITIILPTNTVNLNGSASDADNNITSYLWTKISGPSSFSIANANALQTQVTNLVQGVYQFELKVTDKTRLVDKDTVQVTVNAQSTQPPPCTTCKIVFVSDRDGNSEIYSCNADGSNIIRLTNDPSDDGQPVWSPDNTKIAFISDRSGTPELYIMNADGSNVVQRTFSGSYSQYPTWSPDGTKIAFSSYGIFVIDAAGGSPSLLYEGWEYQNHPAWSPDGAKIAFTSVFYDGRFDYYDYLGIGTINSDGTGYTLLAGVDNNWFQHPNWSPDGAKLSFVTGNSVAGINWDGSGFAIIRNGDVAYGSRTSWSADGTTIAYTSMSADVSWVSADGSASGIIITNGWDADWQH
jgi:dipeptidyl aminopeptidase/acylaminoacyl peptidase